jgi:hypothetical protein
MLSNQPMRQPMPFVLSQNSKRTQKIKKPEKIKETEKMTSTVRTARTLEEELKNPQSLLAIEIYNAITNRDALLRRLEREDFEYASYLYAAEQAEEAEDERAGQRRKEQEAMLSQSLYEYYQAQHEIAEQARMMGVQPLNHYEQAMTAIADHQYKIMLITAQQEAIKTHTKEAKASYAKAAEQWSAKQQAYVDAYFNTVYRSPVSMGGQAFTMDLNGEYGKRFSATQRQKCELERNEARQRACALLPPLQTLERLPEDHLARQQPQPHRVALARQVYLWEIHEFVPVMREVNTWVSVHSPDEQRVLRETFQGEYGGIHRFVKMLMRQARQNAAVRREQLEMLKAHDEMVCFQQIIQQFKERACALEAMKQQQSQYLRQSLDKAALLSEQRGQPEMANLLLQVLHATQKAVVETEIQRNVATASYPNSGMRSSFSRGGG